MIDHEIDAQVICPLCGGVSWAGEHEMRESPLPNTINLPDHHNPDWLCPHCGQWITKEDEDASLDSVDAG